MYGVRTIYSTNHRKELLTTMKLICSKSNLLHGVNIVSKAVPTRTTMAILECILIDASANEIKLTANDMELGIETKIEGEIAERGVIALDAKIFSEIVRKLPDSDVVIETDASFKTTITCEKAKFNIVGKSGDDFSYIPYIERNEAITLSQFTLKEVIRQTIFSIADNDNNKLMTGELFEIEENHLKVVSLDGHRISIRNIELKNNYEHKKVVVPGKTLQEVSKILPGSAEENVNMFLTDNHIVFEFDDTTVVSRLIEGEYFKIEQMLSSDYETKIKINKRELLDCIDRATLLVKEGDKKPIIMNVTDGNMELKINSFIGSMNEDIDIVKEGKDILIGFNPKFFIDALRVIDEEEVSLYMVNPKAPCFIKDDEGKFIYLILPVNFNASTV
jgi:DNA polymerase-3 subunit beta